MYKEKLTELLKKVTEINKDLEELRFGCKLKDLHLKCNDVIQYINKKGGVGTINLIHPQYFSENDKFSDRFEIIGNPIQERHLRMYWRRLRLLEQTSLELFISEEGLVCTYSLELDESVTIAKLDNTKDFSNQSKEVYKSIVEFLESNK